ncbi:MAG TPA: aldo/keto reductase [Rhizomicrobium sp.]|jgi:spore coat polysaccharide biosynthesis protein SpsF|nr:aldo/keto reductase [Rhizomicrobium sp.]
MANPAELVLGSVQLGLAYGAANRTGKPSRRAALRLVRRAAESGITKFDTARAYGDSEARLGEALETRKAVRAITKLSPLSELGDGATREDVRAAVDASIASSMAALRRERIDCLLLHRAAHMTAFGGAIWERLTEKLEDGTVLSLGVSVQSPREALDALAHADVRHIQLAFNLLDWRWREAGVIDDILERPHVTIHARSVFLQGILAADDASVWPAIDGVNAGAVIRELSAIARDFGRESVADLCLAYARGQDWIDGVVVGMETEAQLDDNLRLFVRPPLAPEDCDEIAARVPRVPLQLLDPAQWPKR